jgi:hypothetical protein
MVALVSSPDPGLYEALFGIEATLLAIIAAALFALVQLAQGRFSAAAIAASRDQWSALLGILLLLFLLLTAGLFLTVDNVEEGWHWPTWIVPATGIALVLLSLVVGVGLVLRFANRLSGSAIITGLVVDERPAPPPASGWRQIAHVVYTPIRWIIGFLRRLLALRWLVAVFLGNLDDVVGPSSRTSDVGEILIAAARSGNGSLVDFGVHQVLTTWPTKNIQSNRSNDTEVTASDVSTLLHSLNDHVVSFNLPSLERRILSTVGHWLVAEASGDGKRGHLSAATQPIAAFHREAVLRATGEGWEAVTQAELHRVIKLVGTETGGAAFVQACEQLTQILVEYCQRLDLSENVRAALTYDVPKLAAEVALRTWASSAGGSSPSVAPMASLLTLVERVQDALDTRKGGLQFVATAIARDVCLRCRCEMLRNYEVTALNAELISPLLGSLKPAKKAVKRAEDLDAPAPTYEPLEEVGGLAVLVGVQTDHLLAATVDDDQTKRLNRNRNAALETLQGSPDTIRRAVTCARVREPAKLTAFIVTWARDIAASMTHDDSTGLAALSTLQALVDVDDRRPFATPEAVKPVLQQIDAKLALPQWASDKRLKEELIDCREKWVSLTLGNIGGSTS